MARVPTYDELGVAPRALPGPQQSTVGADTFTVAARQSAMQTAAVDKAADVGMSIAVKMQEREDTDMVFRAEASFQDELLQFETAARERRGEAAKGLTADATKFFDEAREKYLKGLGNDRQRLVFEERLTRTRASTLRSVSGHENQERTESFRKSNEAAIGGSIKRAAANAHDWGIVDLERKNVDSFIAARAAMEGWTKEQRGEMLDKARGAFHTQVLQDLQKNPQTRALAQKYFEKYKEDIPGDLRAELGAGARESTQKAVAMAEADKAYAMFEPKGRTGPIKLDDMEGYLRGVFKDDVDSFQAASALLRARVAAVKSQRAEETNGLEAGVAKLLLDKVSPLKALNSPEMAALAAADPEKANAWRLHLKREAESDASRAAAYEARDFTRLKRDEEMFWRNNIVGYMNLADPTRIAGEKSRDRYILEAIKFGPEKGAALIARYDAFHADSKKLVAAAIDRDLFNDLAQKAGLRPFEKNKSEDDKIALAALQKRVEEIIDQQQRAAGNKELDRPAKEKIMLDEIKNEVLVKGSFFGTNTKRVFELTDADVAKVQVPTQFRNGALVAATRAGSKTPSEADIVRAWLNAPASVKEAYKDWRPK